MPKTNFNFTSPVAEYTVSDTEPNYSFYTSQPDHGDSIDERIFYSLFLPVIAKNKTGQQIDTPVTFFILKPKSLWLIKKGNEITDIHGNSPASIVNYSPSYKVGETIVSLQYLNSPLSVSSFLGSLSISTTPPSLSKMSQNYYILAEDANKENRARIAAPNLPPTNSDSFSRWL